MAGLTPCLRSPMPVAPPLPALLLPAMLRQTLLLVPAAELPESTRIPCRTPAVGAPTALLRILIFNVPLAPLATARMPLPFVCEVWLLETVVVRFGVSAAPNVAPVPTPIPCAPETRFDWTMLPSMVDVTTALPNA